ncbi:TVG1421572 [Thermoplasma volcanium GSS1]|uniref:TVG1421572 protein n=1 Tax=Thermoplasma volcanium (strain ATCC 51530 / DSM 4299 / JCM 9571 / NBRC 15438 / GSS1) TaxID=273116 RepID=Q978P1_THEVO|nr:prephenate dehydrogenase [Thermoplasma volcanium]BAB60516.1 TVG1421572 [Thermoplasma volcanium GSS1]
MKVGIIGKQGRLGRVLQAILDENGFDVVENNWDIAFLSVPIGAAISYIEKYDGPFIEVSSVKTPFKKYAGRIVSIHPLFGPASYKDGVHRTVLFIKDISMPEYRDLIAEMFRGYEIVDTTADVHDKEMAKSLALPYAVAIISKNIDTAFRTKSFDTFKGIVRILENENEEVMLDTINKNPYAQYMYDIVKNLGMVIQ